jgi:hypothetical protein
MTLKRMRFSLPRVSRHKTNSGFSALPCAGFPAVHQWKSKPERDPLAMVNTGQHSRRYPRRTALSFLFSKANCLDSLTRFLQNSTSLNGSESGGGHPPPRWVLRLVRPRNHRVNAAGGVKERKNRMNPLLHWQSCHYSSFSCLPAAFADSRSNPVVFRCPA